MPRTPLVRPRSYFETEPPSLARAAAAVAVVTAVTALAVFVLLTQVTAHLDATVSVDNPAHVAEWACDQQAESVPDQPSPDGCDPSVSETVDRRLGDLLWQRLNWVPGAVVLLVPLAWLFEAAVLYGASALAGGRGRFADVLVVAGWGLVPTAVRAVAVTALVSLRLDSLSVPSSPEAAVEALRSTLTGLDAALGLVTLLAVAWATYVRTYGLASVRDLPVRRAAAVTATLSLLGLLLELT